MPLVTVVYVRDKASSTQWEQAAPVTRDHLSIEYHPNIHLLLAILLIIVVFQTRYKILNVHFQF